MVVDRRTMLAMLGGAGAALPSRWFKPMDLLSGSALEQGSAAQTRWQRRAQRKLEMTRDVTWLTHEPIEFLLRRGDHGDNLAEHYQRMLEPANIRRMAAAGVTYGRIFFYKGFGLEYEKAHIEQARQAAALMHSLGMKVSMYVGGTMFVETFYRETPQAKGWEQRDQWNQPVTYGQQTYRHYACPNEPLYRDYLRRVLRIGIEDLHADEIAFDNIMLQSEPHSCHCPRCIAAFASFLKARYPTREAAMSRFGYPDTSWIEAPRWESPEQPQGLSHLDDPVLQEWVRFRCETLANYSADLYRSVKELNPSTAVLLNIKGVYSFNRYWTNAIYHPLFRGHVDLMAFDTGGYDEHIDKKTGALVSQIRSYKVARRLDSGCEDAFSNDVRSAVHMAFGYQKPVCVPAPMGSGAFNTFTPLLEFFREYNERYYTGTENIADIAAIRTWASMAYSINDTYVPATLMEQVLIQHKIPFDLLFEEQMGSLRKYKAVVLAGQECLSNAQIEQLLSFARSGGAVLLTPDCGRYDEWRETRPRKPFTASRAQGKGKIIVLPEMVLSAASRSRHADVFQNPEPGATPERGSVMTPSQWVLPTNHAELAQAVTGSMSGGPTVSTDAPLTTVMEVLDRAVSRETIVHLINFAPDPLAPVTVHLNGQRFSDVTSATLFVPERDDPQRLELKSDGGQRTVVIPRMAVYAMLVLGRA